MLAAVYPDVPEEALAQLSIGERDRRLLTLRENLFGPQMASMAKCPACSEQLEWTLHVPDLRTSAELQPDVLSVALDGYDVRFRLPSTADLGAVATIGDAGDVRRQLLERCVITAIHEGIALPVEQLPPDIIRAVMERMDQVDPHANISIGLTCPVCSHEWQAVFDIVSYLWAEIDRWARRMLREIHALARAHGWREADILGMSPTRRGMYLEMLHQ